MGMVRVCCSSAAVVGVSFERVEVGCCRPTSSLAKRCIDFVSPGIGQRVSVRMLRPSVHPSFWRSPPGRPRDRPVLLVALGKVHQHTDPQQPVRLLRARRERPCQRCAAKTGNEFSSPDAECHLTSPPMRSRPLQFWGRYHASQSVIDLAKGSLSFCGAKRRDGPRLCEKSHGCYDFF